MIPQISRRDALKVPLAGLLATAALPATGARALTSSNDSLRYSEVSFKASHNSEERSEDAHATLAWDPNEKYQGGCRGLEYDMTRHSDNSGGGSIGFFQVTHSGSDGPPLANYLGLLLSWHSQNTAHDVVSVHLDIKSTEGDYTGFPDEIDTYLGKWFNKSLIFTPQQLTGGADLVTYVRQNQWPTLKTLEGKFLFVLTGNEVWKKFYASDNKARRLCFADVDVSDDDKNAGPPQTGDRAIFNFNLYTDHESTWKVVVPRYRAAHCLVRGYVLNGEDLWNTAKTTGVNMLATDKIRGHSWAYVGDAPFVKTGG
jgi:hypothetical protein